MRQLSIGLTFAVLWASASIATKFGIKSAEPLVLASVRFLLAGVLLIAYCHLPRSAKQRYPIPTTGDWRELTVLGILNTTLYLGCFFTALQSVSAGLASLFIATNPLLITVISAIWMRRKVKRNEWAGILLAIVGLLITTIPTIQSSQASLKGIIILLCGMISFSVGSVRLSNLRLELASVVVNAWQVLIGGLLLTPLALLLNDVNTTRLNLNFYMSLLWLTVPVSILAMQLWLYMLKQDAVQAGTWLLLTPVLGYVLSAILLKEPITTYIVMGTAVVILGLYISRR